MFDYSGLLSYQPPHRVRAEVPALRQLGDRVVLIMCDAGALKLLRAPPSAGPPTWSR